MEQQDFLQKEPIHTAEEEIDIQRILAENAALKDENTELKERLAWFEKQIFGRKSEKTEVVMECGEQLSFFDEPEQEADVNPQMVQTTEVKAHKRMKRTRDEIMKDLRVEEIVHEVTDRICDKCGSEMVVIGKEKIRDELVYVPAYMFLRRHVAKVVKCPSCGMTEEHDTTLMPDTEKCHIRTAEVPASMMPNSFVSPELLAHIIYEKYCNAVPLYRLENDFASQGVKLSRTTMANWIIAASQLWVQPVYEQMHKDLLSSSVIHADETVVQVLNEPGRKAKTDSRMWVYCNGKINDRSNILFEYQPTRNGDHAVNFLGDYRGYLVCDGFDGYNKLKSTARCVCFAHVRRKFVDALPTDKALLPTSAAAQGVEFCNRLFLLERTYSGEDAKGNRVSNPMTVEERYLARQTQSKPVLDEFFAWVERIVVVGGTKLSKAVNYAKSEKRYLYRFLESGEIPIDNNRAENAIRPFCVGRRNWLFSASVKGAQASAMFYSIIATAYANGLNVEKYLTALFRSPAKTVLLPWYLE